MNVESARSKHAVNESSAQRWERHGATRKANEANARAEGMSRALNMIQNAGGGIV